MIASELSALAPALLLEMGEEICRKSNDYQWDFAPVADEVVGRRVDGLTKELARRIGRKEDTVEGAAAVWRLWLKLLQRFPHDAEIWRDELYFSHFIPLAKKYSSKWIDLDDVANFLAIAVRDGLSVDDLRAMLPNQGGRDFKRTCKQLSKVLTRDIIANPRSEVEPRLSRLIVIVTKRLVWLMDKVTA